LPFQPVYRVKDLDPMGDDMTGEGCTRRSVLGASGAGVLGVGLIGLAGCSTGSKSSSSGSPSAGATSAGSSADGGSGGAAALVKLSDVPVGGSVAAKSAGKPVVVSQKTPGAVTAFSAICTHMGCTVNAGGNQFHCPCHGSVYDAFTGAVVHGPAPAPLTAIPVKVVGGDVVTG
jgi:Rieske Fe-S protein